MMLGPGLYIRFFCFGGILIVIDRRCLGQPLNLYVFESAIHWRGVWTGSRQRDHEIDLRLGVIEGQQKDSRDSLFISETPSLRV